MVNSLQFTRKNRLGLTHRMHAERCLWVLPALAGIYNRGSRGLHLYRDASSHHSNIINSVSLLMLVLLLCEVHGSHLGH